MILQLSTARDPFEYVIPESAALDCALLHCFENYQMRFSIID